MSTLGLVILVSFVALAGVGALAYLRLREQQQLERARHAIALTDDIIKFAETLSTLGAYVSQPSKHLLAQHILQLQQQLQQLGIKSSQPVKRASSLAHQSLEEPPSNKKPPLPTDSKPAQRFSEQTRHLSALVRVSYQKGKLDKNSAAAIAREARSLNLRVCYGVFDSKARAALAMNTPSRATRFVDKAKNLLKNNRDDLPVLTQALERLQHDVKTAQAKLAPPTAPSRLETGAQELADSDEAWKKKHF
ncbi:hypothetical protein CHH28_13250 [Bacterioplanes sanyensis]|uniref:Uncharacterized protein n=1 Tax=Bacterioplanes sanyensis TaxID=1249553 RepID=A0A222FM37_9GAMM|nr:hypothetical protein [Bacterioplanes sanyensis]ASP39584.1 hypothetical protein CHH28_13250 [Bacterioplanes sanyensis]